MSYALLFLRILEFKISLSQREHCNVGFRHLTQ